LGGGSLSIGLIISIISALPIQLVNAGYNKAVEKYGAEKVDGALDKVESLTNALANISQENQELKDLLNSVNDKLDKAEQIRQQFLNE
jgi:cell division protein FtsB